MNKTTPYPNSKRERALKPLFGVAAVFATMATLGLAVVGPVALSHGPTVYTVEMVAARSEAPTEVAIEPASINVVAKRVKVARSNARHFVPATYQR
jgi:hypothetical protein